MWLEPDDRRTDIPAAYSAAVMPGTQREGILPAVTLPPSASSRAVRALGFLIVAAVCSWPYVETLRFWPMTSDPPLWIGKASALDAEGLRWVFLGDHFTWYRPVTALSFTLDHALGGLDPLAYRLTDLGFHLVAAALVGRLARALDPRRRVAVGLAAAALFMLHPGTEDVVPYIARRSYSIASALGLGALCLVAGSGSPRDGGLHVSAAALGGVLLATALLANEAAVVMTPVALLLAWSTGTRRPLPLVGLALPTVVALAARTAVLGGIGGYGDAALGAVDRGAALASMGAATTGLAWLDGRWGSTLLVVVVISLVIACLAAGLRSRDAEPGPGRASAWILLVWLAGTASLFLFSGLWVDRQVYFLQAPLVLLFASWVAALASPASRKLAALALPGILLSAASLVATSPVLRGQDAVRMESWRLRQGVLAPMPPLLRGIDAPACVHTVLPNTRRRFRLRPAGPRTFVHQSTRHPLAWARVLVDGRDVRISDWIYFGDTRGRATLEPGSAPAVDLPAGEYLERTLPDMNAGLEWIVWNPGFELRGPGAPRRLRIDPPACTSGGPCYLYSGWADGGELIRLEN